MGLPPVPSFFPFKRKDSMFIRLCYWFNNLFNLRHIHYRTDSREKEDSKTSCVSAFFALPIAFFFLLTVRPHDGFPAESASYKVNLSHIAAIESSGRPDAVGDGGKALGLYQLHPAPIQEYFQFNKTGNPSYNPSNCALKPSCATLVADWYLHKRIPQMLRYYRVPVTRDWVLVAYNAGIKAAKERRVPKTTAAYFCKYVALHSLPLLRWL